MKILTVVGARPQFIKAHPVSLALREAGITEFLLHTGQHYDERMSGCFFTDLGLRAPDLNLNVGSGSHGAQTAAMLTGIERCLLDQTPDWVLVYGDTNSTLAGALAAAKLHIPIAHVEAGLRSFNRRMPEEVNRVLTDHASTLLFCPAESAAANLHKEGIQSGVHVVGDVMADALFRFLPRATDQSRILATLGLPPHAYLLCTIHRAENTEEPAALRRLFTGLAGLGRPVLIPLHPRTRTLLEASGGLPACENLRFTEPLGYLDMLQATANAHAVLTDSGGLQKEAYWLGVQCITLREESEWTETLEHGWNQLTGTDLDRITRALGRPPSDTRLSLYGNGGAAKLIASHFHHL